MAATLRVAEQIVAGVDRIEDIAAAAKCNAAVLHGVLQHLAKRGVFEERETGRFALNEMAKGLLDPALRLGLDLEGIGGRMAYAWSTLPTYVRTGEPAYQDVFGKPFWEDLEANPEIAASFDALMGPLGHGVPDPDFPLAEGWERVRTVVDVGGGTGALLAEILRARPGVHGILVDLPGTVARSAEILRAAGVADRVKAIGQSFFDPLPASADLYVLKGVLNDWPDREAAAILRRCAEAARPDGRVVVLKGVVPDGVPKGFSISDLLVGGKTRTVGEFRELARGGGLEVVAVGRQASGPSVVECRPLAQ
ncbi:MAG TPA: methyltransferase [Candidatus Acidoferrales bacterium]|nr:methyltransferase [Candidatus Acidoferrales bacterium]